MPTIHHALDDARARIRPRLRADELEDARARGAIVVDTRPLAQRERDGELPGAIVIDRNVLEWRLDPTSANRIRQIEHHDHEIVIVCNEGYASSLAAATLRDLGLHRATDLDGGYRAWLRYSLTSRADVSVA
jgi:rhodanese-related sulfurtransferase